VLLFASAGVLDHSGIKVPFFSFFFHDSGIRVKEAPKNMLAAMGIASFLCIAIGVWPGPLYAILPYPVAFEPYTVAHVINQSQLLLFAMLAFVFLMRTGLYPPELPSVNVDFDIIYRKGLPLLIAAFARTFGPIDQGARRAMLRLFHTIVNHIYRHHGPEGALARSVGSGSMVFWVVAMLAGYLVISLASF
jgi:multicomponent Na+:H+ antiporter subunit D